MLKSKIIRTMYSCPESDKSVKSVVIKKTRHYEKGNLEIHHSDNHSHPDGYCYQPRRHILHGALLRRKNNDKATPKQGAAFFIFRLKELP